MSSNILFSRQMVNKIIEVKGLVYFTEDILLKIWIIEVADLMVMKKFNLSSKICVLAVREY